jgi:hypothetical protein
MILFTAPRNLSREMSQSILCLKYLQSNSMLGSNGANLSFPKYFGIDDQANTRDSFLVGLINAAPYS